MIAVDGHCCLCRGFSALLAASVAFAPHYTSTQFIIPPLSTTTTTLLLLTATPPGKDERKILLSPHAVPTLELKRRHCTYHVYFIPAGM